MMIILREPLKAEELGEFHYGPDGYQISYPLVNTCMTITYVYPDLLVGAHFGMLDVDGVTPAGQIRSTLQLMRSISPAGDPELALLIGNMDWWTAADDNTFENLRLLRQDIRDTTHREPDTAPNIEHETVNYSGGTVNIDIFHHGLIVIQSEDEKDFKSLNFRGGRVVGHPGRGKRR